MTASRPSVRRHRALVFAILTGLLAAGCISSTPPGVLFTSQPVGARILVDGEDSGFVTPRMLRLDRRRHQVEIQHPGHEPRTVSLRPARRGTVVTWYYAITSTRFPLFATTEDLFAPIKVDSNLSPGRIHVRLRPRTAD